MQAVTLIGGAPEFGYPAGVLLDIPEAQYHALPRLSKSLISGYKTPKHLALEMEKPHERKEAFDQGSAFHVMMLEPHLFDEKVAILPSCSRQGAANQATHAKFEAENIDKAWIKAEYRERVNLMRESVISNPECAKYLARGRAEKALFWTDQYGLLWKMRMDWLTELGGEFCIVDLKKTANGADPKDFAKTVGNYKYHWQAYLYREGFFANFGIRPRFVFIAVEDEAPFCSAVYELDEGSLLKAAADIEPIRAELAELIVTQKLERKFWPGYPAVTNTISVPSWA